MISINFNISITIYNFLCLVKKLSSKRNYIMKTSKKILSVLTSSVLAFSAIALPENAMAKSESLKISSLGEQLKFDKSELTVTSGSDVTLTFKNTSSSMPHNWVLTLSGTADKVASNGIGSGEAKSYVKPGDKNVIAYTALAKPGKTVSVKFKAPKKGTYDFVCTSPGHSMMMKGKLIVK